MLGMWYFHNYNSSLDQSTACENTENTVVFRSCRLVLLRLVPEDKLIHTKLYEAGGVSKQEKKPQKRKNTPAP